MAITIEMVDGGGGWVGIVSHGWSATRARLLPPPLRPALLPALLLATTACTAGRWPTSHLDRPLSAPAGHHQAAYVATRVEVDGAEPGRLDSIAWGLYRYGVSDELDYLLPLGVGYRFGPTGELALSALLAPFYTRRLVSGRVEDPRQPPPQWRQVGPALGPRLAVAARVPLDPSLALLVHGDVLWSPFDAAAFSSVTSLGATALVRLTSWADLGCRAAVSLAFLRDSDEPTLTWTVGGFAHDSYAPVPMLALHLTDTIDLQLATSVSWLGARREPAVRWAAGLDWHFD